MRRFSGVETESHHTAGGDCKKCDPGLAAVGPVGTTVFFLGELPDPFLRPGCRGLVGIPREPKSLLKRCPAQRQVADELFMRSLVPVLGLSVRYSKITTDPVNWKCIEQRAVMQEME